MAFINTLNKHIRQIGQKMTPQNIHNFGTKVMNTSHVIGRKLSHTLHKIEDIGSKALPVVSTIASMAGYPELGGAIASASNGLKKITNVRKNVDTVRNMLPAH